jgi:hypothetical protein
MNILLHETQPFSNVELFSKYCKYNKVVIEACEHYQKRSLRNKYFILTSQGILPLAIPLKKGKNNKMPIKDVRIAYEENWQKTHLGAIRAAYGKSPYFEHYFDEIEALFMNNHEFLFDFNKNTMTFLLKKLKCNIIIEETTEYQKCHHNDMDDFRDYPWSQPNRVQNPSWKYVQAWTAQDEFYNNLSTLDLLFSTGPESFLHLIHYKK